MDTFRCFVSLRACPTSIQIMKQAQQTFLLTGYLYCTWSFEKFGPIKVKWMSEDRRKVEVWRPIHYTRVVRGQEVWTGWFGSPVNLLLHTLVTVMYLLFFKSRNIPELSQSQIIINQHSKTTFKSSCTTYSKSLTRTDCRTQEKLFVWFLNLISLVWNIKKSVNYVDKNPILISQDFNKCF